MATTTAARRARPLQVVALALLTALALALPIESASAGDSQVERRGDCSGPSEWRLRIRREDGGKLRVRYEIEGGRAGQEWHVYLSHNGDGFFAGTRISSSGGTVEVRVRRPNRAGPDTITAGANNIVTGETCGGRATL